MAARKCLIVDDDPVFLTALSGMVGQLGYEVRKAPDGHNAVKMLAESGFDIMITDIAMRGMDGIQLTRRAKQMYPDMPVVMMTGFTDEFSYDSAIEAGAADFLKKPFSFTEVEVRVARVMRDVEAMAIVKKREQELGAMSTEMIMGIQEEGQEKLRQLQALEAEVARLKKELGAKG